MTIKQYVCCVQSAADYSDPDAYVSDLALSSVWGSEEGEIPADRITALRGIYTAYHRTVKDIAAAAGLPQRKLAERFGIPYRTVEDWCRGINTCPVYTRLMMQECLGLFRPSV